MDLKEAWQRIVVRHWAIILFCTVLGLAVPVAINQIKGQPYVGTARVDFGVDAHGGQDATSLGDTGQGLATSPDVLTAALKQAKVSRSVPDMIANNVVTVSPVGTSGVLDVSVTDDDPRSAAAVANGLATQIVQLRDQAEFGSSQRLLLQLQVQEAALSRQIAAVVGNQKRYFYTVPGLQAQQADLVAQRTAVDQRLQQLSQDLATAIHPRVIDASATSGVATQSGLAVMLALGGVLGLVAGVALAATVEAARPTLSRHALARQLGVPLLGRLPRPVRGISSMSPWLARYVGVAARRAGKDNVLLVPVGRRPADVTSLAEALERMGTGARVIPLQLPSGSGEVPAVPVEQSDVGIVVVAPTTVKAKHLADLQRHLAVTREPVLGLISYRGRLRRVEPALGDDLPEDVVSPGAAHETASPAHAAR